MQEDEREIIKRCQSGDAHAFEQLFYKYQKKVYNVAYRMMGNRQDAEDVTQEVFSVYIKSYLPSNPHLLSPHGYTE